MITVTYNLDGIKVNVGEISKYNKKITNNMPPTVSAAFDSAVLGCNRNNVPKTKLYLPNPDKYLKIKNETKAIHKYVKCGPAVAPNKPEALSA